MKGATLTALYFIKTTLLEFLHLIGNPEGQYITVSNRSFYCTSIGDDKDRPFHDEKEPVTVDISCNETTISSTCGNILS